MNGPDTIDDLEALRRPLWRYACHACGNAADADDLVQDVFMRCLTAVARGVVIEDLRHWVFVAAKRLSIDRGKTRAHRARHLTPNGITEAMAYAIADGSMPLDEQICQQERTIRMREAVAALTPMQRRCIQLRANGLVLREIACALDSDVRRVSEAIARAVPHLQRALDLPVTPVHLAPSRLKRAA